jgi:hypothetical protein
MKTKVYLGIDPGKTGACAFYFPEKSTFGILDFPQKEKDVQHFLSLFASFTVMYDIDFCVLEKATARPGQGVVSMFNYGVNYGMWKAILLWNEIPFIEKTPMQWMKGIVPAGSSEKSKNKERNAKVLLNMFPKERDSFYGKKGGLLDGRVDAALISIAAHRIKMGLK